MEVHNDFDHILGQLVYPCMGNLKLFACFGVLSFNNFVASLLNLGNNPRIRHPSLPAASFPLVPPPQSSLFAILPPPQASLKNAV